VIIVIIGHFNMKMHFMYFFNCIWRSK